MSETRPARDDSEFQATRARTITVLGVFGTSVALGLSTRYSPESPHPVPLTAPSTVAHGLDPNDAAWFELAHLPGIGESIARQIVAHREDRLRTGAPPPIFRNGEDLLAVRGIGPKMMLRIGRFLRYPPPVASPLVGDESARK